MIRIRVVGVLGSWAQCDLCRPLGWLCRHNVVSLPGPSGTKHFTPVTLFSVAGHSGQLTKANCAQPMDYFQSMLLMLLAFKAVLAVVLFLAWAVPWARKRWRSYQRWRAVPEYLRASSTVRRRNKPGAPTKRLRGTDWVKVCEHIVRLCCWNDSKGVALLAVLFKLGTPLSPLYAISSAWQATSL